MESSLPSDPPSDPPSEPPSDPPSEPPSALPSNMPSIKYNTLVLSGGGIKGIAHLGALQALDDLHLLEHINTFSGTSVGSLIIVLLVIGYTPRELYTFMTLLDVNKMKELNFGNLLSNYGLDDGGRFDLVLKKFFHNKSLNPDITFAQLYELTNKTIYISAVCLNEKKTYYFTHTTHPNLSILLAIRMSVSIPIFFIPVKYDNKLFVDGACIDNYPIHLFTNLEQIIGIYLKDHTSICSDINNIETMLLNTIQCLLEGVAHNSIRSYGQYTNIITIDNVSSIDFNLDLASKSRLFDLGYTAIFSKYNI